MVDFILNRDTFQLIFLYNTITAFSHIIDNEYPNTHLTAIGYEQTVNQMIKYSETRDTAQSKALLTASVYW